MTEFVLDASVALRWTLRDVQLPLADQVEQLVRSGQGTANVPALWHWEMANGLLQTMRIGHLRTPRWDSAWEDLEVLSAAVTTEPGPDRPVAATARVARLYKLTVYDAAYLEMALRRSLPLATLDQDLRRAAERAGVAVEF